MQHTIYWNEKYTGAKHAFDTTRKSKHIADAIGHEHISDPAKDGHFNLQDADEAIRKAITPEYYEALQTGGHMAESNGFKWDYGIWEMALNSTLGVINAASYAYKNKTIAGSLSSGLHHADHNRGGGFCTVNGLAVAANFMLEMNPSMKILILDFDAHCGGGTVRTLRHLGIDKQVRQVDISTNYFDDYAEDDTHFILSAHSEDEYIEQMQNAFDLLWDDQIDLVLYNAGTDPYPRISHADLAYRDQVVFSETYSADTPVAYVLAGGYTHAQTMDELVQSHINTINKAEKQIEWWEKEKSDKLTV